MNIKSKNIIFTLCIGILIGIISIATNQVSIATNQESINTEIWMHAFIFCLATALGIPFYIAFLKALPESIKLKCIFNIKYFYYVSFFTIGAGITFTPFLIFNGNNIATSMFFLLFGVSIFTGSFIASKLFGES